MFSTNLKDAVDSPNVCWTVSKFKNILIIFCDSNSMFNLRKVLPSIYILTSWRPVQKKDCGSTTCRSICTYSNHPLTWSPAWKCTDERVQWIDGPTLANRCTASCVHVSACAHASAAAAASSTSAVPRTGSASSSPVRVTREWVFSTRCPAPRIQARGDGSAFTATPPPWRFCLSLLLCFSPSILTSSPCLLPRVYWFWLWVSSLLFTGRDRIHQKVRTNWWLAALARGTDFRALNSCLGLNYSSGWWWDTNRNTLTKDNEVRHTRF